MRTIRNLVVATASMFLLTASAEAVDNNHPGVIEPALSATTGNEVRIPHTDQAAGDELLNVSSGPVYFFASDTLSLLGHPIEADDSPNDDMEDALKDLADAAKGKKQSEMKRAAQALLDILLGTTQGEIYDGFAMLNYNRGAFVADHVSGEYKMKVLRDTGETEVGILGAPVKIWEIDVNMLYYDGQIDSDTFLMRVPVEAGAYDTVRVNYRIFSTEREDFSPTVVMLDNRLSGSVQFPYKGFDSVWVPFGGGDVMELSVMLPPLSLQRGVYTWGWRVHPPRIQFMQPVYETVNAHTGAVELAPQGRSFAFRNAELSIDGISNAAPEKKMYIVAQAALSGTSARNINLWLTEADQGPRGTWQEWADLAKDQQQLPPEARDVLAAEGVDEGKFGPYRMVSVFMNNEMYGDGPEGSSIDGWAQGDTLQVKLINLDNHTHYFRNVDFGARLHDDIRGCCGAGSHSFEIMNFKPTYGAPKVAEMQYRAGWGFRPHFDVIQQSDVFPRAADQQLLKAFTDGGGDTHTGYQYSAAARGGDFRFNPPPFIIGTHDDPAPFPLREADGSNGLVIGQTTEGYGVAKMCPGDPSGFCQEDFGPVNPNGVLNWPAPNDPSVPKTELRFPPFLRNPNATEGGDIIPPTGAWKPFLWVNPHNGSLYIDPSDPSKGYWADLTYSHGAPVLAGESLTATVESPRGSAQVFYQFDDLFHDNAIFSPHPKFEAQ
jgi:hypothetical protein